MNELILGIIGIGSAVLGYLNFLIIIEYIKDNKSLTKRIIAGCIYLSICCLIIKYAFGMYSL